MYDTEAYLKDKDEREKFSMLERARKHFDLTSNRLNLDLIQWGNLIQVHSVKNDVNKLFFVSQATGAFAIKMCADIVPTFFATRLF